MLPTMLELDRDRGLIVRQSRGGSALGFRKSRARETGAMAPSYERETGSGSLWLASAVRDP
jgi:hypothetical protein